MKSLRLVKTLPALLILLLAGGAPAVAAPDPGVPAPGVSAPDPAAGSGVPGRLASSDAFAGMDADRNGVLNWDEFHAAFPNMRQAAFERIDANGDALIDRQEWEAFRLSHGKGGMAGRPGMKPTPPASSPSPDAAPRPTPANPAGKPGILPPAAR